MSRTEKISVIFLIILAITIVSYGYGKKYYRENIYTPDWAYRDPDVPGNYIPKGVTVEEAKEILSHFESARGLRWLKMTTSPDGNHEIQVWTPVSRKVSYYISPELVQKEMERFDGMSDPQSIYFRINAYSQGDTPEESAIAHFNQAGGNFKEDGRTIIEDRSKENINFYLYIDPEFDISKYQNIKVFRIIDAEGKDEFPNPKIFVKINYSWYFYGL